MPARGGNLPATGPAALILKPPSKNGATTTGVKAAPAAAPAMVPAAPLRTTPATRRVLPATTALNNIGRWRSMCHRYSLLTDIRNVIEMKGKGSA